MSLIRICVIGTLSYITIVVLLRYFGKRALTKFNAFDTIVTVAVAVGSAFASAVMSKDISYLDGLVAFVLRLVLQRSFAGLSIRMGWFGRHLKSQPLVIVYSGMILWKNARSEQIGEMEILAALRNSGVAAIEDVLALVLESDGSFSLLPLSAAPDGKIPNSLKDVKGVPEFSDENIEETKTRLPHPLT